MTAFKITARTVLELGSELISSDIIAFYELIKNGFDAGTRNGVEIRFDIGLSLREYRQLTRMTRMSNVTLDRAVERTRDALNPDALSIYEAACERLDGLRRIDQLKQALDEIYALNMVTVVDTGHGMSKADLESIFLVIGTASRKKKIDAAIANHETRSPYFGEKGIGRLSAMRLGNKLSVRTSRAGDAHWNCLDIDWTAFGDLDAMLDEIHVAPKRGEIKLEREQAGTQIMISDLASDWTRQRLEELARNEFSLMSVPVAGERKRKRVALFWNGERIAIPMLDENLLSHAHAAVKGEYTTGEAGPRLYCQFDIINLGFDHPHEKEILDLGKDELISTVIGKDSGLDITALDTVGSFSFEAYWFNRRRLSGIDSIGDRATVRKLHARWTGIRLYRDGFRVYPYGAEEDDWLSLDRTALMSRGYTLNKIQFIGRVNISRMANPELIDQTNREGLRETPEQSVLLESLRYVVQHHLRQSMHRVETQYKEKRVDMTGAKDEVKSLERRATTAIKALRRATSKEERETVNDLQQILFEFSEFASRARARIEEVESDARRMIDMAGVGLLVEVVAHELARVSEHALNNLNVLQRKSVPEDVRNRLESLRSSMKSISKRLRVLDPLSVSGRQRAEIFDLQELLVDTFAAHEAQFERHGISLKLALPDSAVRSRLVKGMVVQILENLISNSVYWMGLEKLKNPTFTPTLEVSLEIDPVTIYFEDNGPGIAPEYAERIFDLFFSLKEKNRRRGMGLYIARDCAEFNGGSLYLDLEKKNAIGKLNRFVYICSADRSS